MLAISAHHRQLPGAALAYKVAAMKGLHESVTTLGGGLCVVSPETTLATAMMLCMYSVSALGRHFETNTADTSSGIR